MSDEKTELEVQDQFEELDEESLAEVTGGSMRDKVYITPTTDISDDTRRKI